MAAVEALPQWLQAGGVATTMSFFMWFIAVWARRLEAGQNRLARAQCILVISLKQANDEAKSQARSIIEEIDVLERPKP